MRFALKKIYSGMNLAGKNVIDVDVHSGRHTIPLAMHIGISGVLMAFEPVPDIRQQLVVNLLNYKINNVVVLPFVLSATPALSDFFYIPNLPEEGGLRKRHAYNEVPSEFRTLSVAVKRLDELIPKGMKMDFIKIDVEGGGT
jgi:FkbM family methyltransferase